MSGTAIGTPGSVFRFWKRPDLAARRARLPGTDVAVSGVAAAISVRAISVRAVRAIPVRAVRAVGGPIAPEAVAAPIPVYPQTIAISVPISIVPEAVPIPIVGAGTRQPVVGLGLKRVPGRARRIRRYRRIAVAGG